MSDQFWYEDPMILINKNRLSEFFPHDDMTLYEKLNSIVRFSIYFALLVFSFKRSKEFMFFPLFVSGITLYLYKINYKPEDNTCLYKLSKSKHLKCQPPTDQNPFMNVLISDYDGNPNRNPACNINEENIKKNIQESFEKNLYQNTVDIWGRNNSQREYYTMPNTTIPNDQINFANWLYKTPTTCKEITSKCNVEQDLRHKRKPISQITE